MSVFKRHLEQFVIFAFEKFQINNLYSVLPSPLEHKHLWSCSYCELLSTCICLILPDFLNKKAEIASNI